MARKKVSVNDEKDVLVFSKRRCALCYGVSNEHGEKKGQIAHLDHDSSNSVFENLVFLCFDHHDAYDSTTRQSKNYTAAEIRHYRDKLYSYLHGQDQSKSATSITNKNDENVSVMESEDIEEEEESESTDQSIEDIIKTKHQLLIKKCDTLNSTVSPLEWKILKAIVEIGIFKELDVTLSKLLLELGKSEDYLHDELKNLATRLGYIEYEDNEISLIGEAKILNHLGDKILIELDLNDSDISPDAVFGALF